MVLGIGLRTHLAEGDDWHRCADSFFAGSVLCLTRRVLAYSSRYSFLKMYAFKNIFSSNGFHLPITKTRSVLWKRKREVENDQKARIQHLLLRHAGT